MVSENVHFGGRGVFFTLGDIDGNGDTDIVIDVYGETLVMSKHDNAYSLSNMGQHILESTFESHVEVMDFDGDGQQDIVLFGGSMQVYYGGQKAFSTAVE